MEMGFVENVFFFSFFSFFVFKRFDGTKVDGKLSSSIVKNPIKMVNMKQ